MWLTKAKEAPPDEVRLTMQVTNPVFVSLRNWMNEVMDKDEQRVSHSCGAQVAVVNLVTALHPSYLISNNDRFMKGKQNITIG